ncbi:MAG: AbrB/MazE/SpoVT family DNA-binding domain-containing protein [Promethearchaeota archaeon]
MRTTLKIVKIGNSRGIIIPSYILERLSLDVNDLVEIEIIRKVNKEKKK